MCHECFLHVYCLYVDVVTQPENKSVLLGESTTFLCAGRDVLTIVWTINSINVEDLDINPNTDVVDGVRNSTLTLTGSVENNKVPIQCSIHTSDSLPVLLTPVFLTVLGKP